MVDGTAPARKVSDLYGELEQGRCCLELERVDRGSQSRDSWDPLGLSRRNDHRISQGELHGMEVDQPGAKNPRSFHG